MYVSMGYLLSWYPADSLTNAPYHADTPGGAPPLQYSNCPAAPAPYVNVVTVYYYTDAQGKHKAVNSIRY